MLFNFMQINNYSPIICPIHPSNSDITTQNIAGRKASIFMVCQQKYEPVLDSWTSEKKREQFMNRLLIANTTPLAWFAVNPTPFAIMKSASLAEFQRMKNPSQAFMPLKARRMYLGCMKQMQRERTAFTERKKGQRKCFHVYCFFFLPSIGKEKLLVKKEFEWIQLGCMERY